MSGDDTYEIPLQDQRVFGAGIKRKRVQFVPSTSAASTTARGDSSAKSISDLYLSVVLPKDTMSTTDTSSKSEQCVDSENISNSPPNKFESDPQPVVCEICNLPLSSIPSSVASVTDESSRVIEDSLLAKCPKSKSRPHEASLAHQVCLSHSHPPSHLDRNRKGLVYLASYGWDPDSRLGLGASGQGIQFPIKAKAKDDKMGIGVVLPQESERRKKEKPVKLDAGKVRKLQEKDKRKAEKLRDMFYRSEDVDLYLGIG